MIRVIKYRVTTNINIFILSVLLIPFAAVLPRTAMGQSVINIDFEAGVPGDATHFGADGVMSTPGNTVWNSVYPNQAANDLPDESGAATVVDIEFNAGPASGVVLPAFPNPNDLQDSGVQDGSVWINGLRPDGEYTLAIYADSYTSVTITDVSGAPYSVECIMTTNIAPSLPGNQYIDYCLLQGIKPYLSGATPYIEIQPSAGPLGGGVMMGLQISGDIITPECSTDADCDDTVGCTDDICDASQVCQNTPNDALCDNGFWCDGDEVCDLSADCQAGSDPCAGYDFCLENSDLCSDVECNVPSDCPPGQTCSEDGNCVDIQCSVDAECDDGVDCTDDVCDALFRVCQHNPNDSLCDNGFYCDGIDVCDPTNDCQAGTDPCEGYDFCLESSDECSDVVECNVSSDCVFGQICSTDFDCVDVPAFILHDPDPAISFDLLVEGQEAGFVIGYYGAAGELAARQIYWIFPDGFDLNDPGPEGTVVGTVDVDITGDGTPEALYNIVVGGTSSEGTPLYYVDYDGDWEIDPREPRIAASTGCIIINIIVPYGGSKDTLTVPMDLRTTIKLNPGLITPTEPGTHVLKLIVLSVDPDTGDSDDGMNNPPVEVAFEYPIDVLADTDGDGIPDGDDLCPEDPNKSEFGICGCGELDTDSDSDGVADCKDACPSDADKNVPGACGCGVPDTDTDGDDVADCQDACPNDPEKTAPGVCGCGELDADSDSDGSPHCLDCDDGDGSIRPGAEELCNDVDDDCDGVVDEGCECGPDAIPGDLDSDCDVDWHDVLIILRHLFRSASVCPDCDLNGDGWITFRDVKKCIFMCSCRWCAFDCPK